jgi:GDP-L-fucose synthase|tara:strand:+ start:1365 stop:2288 length:924 start_codon:yes stop_codon:yes gene_type:complete
MFKLLVTGGTGLVGSSIPTVHDHHSNIKLSSKDGNLVDKEETNKLFSLHKPTHVVHTAARVGGVGGNMSAKGAYYYDNIMINTNVLEACRIYEVTKLVSLLSTCVFPNDIEYPLTEDKFHLGEPHESNYGYSYAKRMIDVQSKVYREQYGVNFVNVIPTNIYGPHDNFDTKNGHVLPSLIHKCYLAKKNNTDLVIWGSGNPLREFIYSKDIGKLIIWALEHYNEPEPIIFSPSEEISIKDLVDLIVKAVGFTGKVIFDTTKPEGQFRKPSDNSKLRSYLPDFEFTPIETGIKETVEWFETNFEHARK